MSCPLIMRLIVQQVCPCVGGAYCTLKRRILSMWATGLCRRPRRAARGMHLLNNEPHNEGVAHCESSLFNNEGIGAHCWNNEPYNEQKSSLLAGIASELIMSPPSLLQTL